jgi:hypothetical protein
MRLAAAASLLLVVMAFRPAIAAAQDQPDRQAWRSEITTARVRADAYRDQLKTELERRKIERLLNLPISEDVERAQRASDEVRNDASLQKGDIVSTADGLFVFVGDPEGDHKPPDFVPLAPRASRR